MNFEETLIEEVRKHPLLYNVALADYKNIKKKESAWKEVAAKVKANEKICKRRWKIIRDSYKRCKRSKKSTTRKGSARSTKKWRHMDSMSFLDSVKSSRYTVDNIPEEDSIPDEESLPGEDSILEEGSIPEECSIPEEGTINNEDIIPEEDRILVDSDHIKELEKSDVEESPSTSRAVEQSMNNQQLNKFLKQASQDISKTCNVLVKEHVQENSVTLHMKSLAATINESNMPSKKVNKLLAKLSAVVFAEVDKYY